MALKRAFVAITLHSTYSNYAQGVTIMLAKLLRYTITAVIDPYGRYVIVVLHLNYFPYTLVALYVPLLFTVMFWDTVMAQVLQVVEGP